MLRPLLLAIALLPLAACDGGKGTSISINASDGDGNVVTSVDAGGNATIDLPFFKGKVSIPKLKLDASNFDMNGVHLYPGSTISGVNVDAQDGPAKDDNGTVRLSFNSPAAPATVRDWFKDKLNATGFKLQANGNGLTGTTDDDKPFTLDLTPDGTDRAKGVIKIG
jgi:hypothetical protein